MGRYIVRTKEGRVHLLRMGREYKLIGYINYDFILRGKALPVRSEVRNSDGIVGWVETFHPSRSCIRVYNDKKEEISYLEKSNRLRIDGVYISFNQLSRSETIHLEEEESRVDRKKLEEAGLTHSYFLNDSKFKGRLYCFVREGDISTLLYTDTKIKSGIEELLRFLPLAISKRVFEQDFIRRFIGT